MDLICIRKHLNRSGLDFGKSRTRMDFVFSNLILVFEALKAFLVCGHPKGSRSPAPAAFALGQ